MRKTPWAWTVATFFGAGLGKPGPGTWGSVAALLLWAAVAWGLHPAPLTLVLILLAGIMVSIAVGVPAATIVARESAAKTPSSWSSTKWRASGSPCSAAVQTGAMP